MMGPSSLERAGRIEFAERVQRGGNSGRVLVVDDETDLVALLTTYLGLHGIEVVGTTTVAGALDLIGGVDAVLADFCLDDGDGVSLVSAARALVPGLPAIVMSPLVVGLRNVEGDIVLVPKPFALQDLAAIVLAMVGSGARSRATIGEWAHPTGSTS